MELHRIPPFPLAIDYTLDAETDYILSISTDRNSLLEDIEATSDEDGIASFELSEVFSRYDGEYAVIVYLSDGGDKGDVVLMDNVRIVRPYVNVTDIAPIGRDDEYTKYELMARTWIDSLVGGFYYTKLNLSTIATGSDYLYLGHRINKVLSVVENNVLVYVLDGDNEMEYTVADDGVCLIVRSDIEIDYTEGSLLTLPAAGSDSYIRPGNSLAFPRGYDYRVTVESGWPVVPQDIQEVTKLLIEDMACDTPNYVARYMRTYETKDFKVDFHRGVFTGTGNLLVDDVLKKYWGQTLYNNVRVL